MYCSTTYSYIHKTVKYTRHVASSDSNNHCPTVSSPKAHGQNANTHHARKNGHSAIPNAQRSAASLVAWKILVSSPETGKQT